MPERDATLDAFVSSSEEDDGDGDEPSDSGENTEGEKPPAADEATQREATQREADESQGEVGDERAETTFAWSPEGTACEACGTVTDRRWRTDAGFVCPSCVDWERTPNQ